MPHEIYYTSAPEGLKPGQRGFCTVATSPNISKPLWDRLESISGYRHQFDPATDPGRNPVAWAHWLLQVGGREVSVLSRVCDAGLDYTQRTNAFAHHLALEPEERAAAGPAWMLRQGGVMVPAWDGHVGQISRTTPLPRGDATPRPCTTWQQLTGDAGWAGVLAEAAAKNARKPVCILFNPDQDLLPLVAEAVALLPAAQRWQVTFNTYFTSLPGNAACAWRCCLEGTPAAAEARRHAAGGLVLDLANPSRLGTPPGGTWVELARTGRAAGTPAASGKRPTAVFTRGKAKRAGGPPDLPAAEDLPADLSEVPLAEPPPMPAYPSPAWGPVPQGAPPPAPGTARRHDAARVSGESRVVDTSWTAVRARTRRRWLIGLAALAVAFVGAGTWFQVSAYRASSDRPLPPPPPATAPTLFATTAEAPEPKVVHVAPPTPATREAVAPVAPPPPTTRETVQVAAPPPRPPPATIDLMQELLPPAPPGGAGIRTPPQSISISANKFDDLRAIGTFLVTLPGGRSTYAVTGPHMAGEVQLALDRGDKRWYRYTLSWQGTLRKGVNQEVATLTFDPNPGAAAGPKLEIGWNPQAVLSHPAMTAIVYALLQQADMAVADAAGRRPQKIVFKPSAAMEATLGAGRSPIAGARPLPPMVKFRLDGDMAAAGWQVSTKFEGENADDKRSPETSTTVLTFTAPATADRAECLFDVRIAPGWKGVECNIATQLEYARNSRSLAVTTAQEAETQVGIKDREKTEFMASRRREVAEAEAQLRLSDEQLKARFATREGVARRLDQARQDVAAAEVRWNEDVRGIIVNRDEAVRRKAAKEAAVTLLEQVRQADVAVELPDGLRAATLRLKRTP